MIFKVLYNPSLSTIMFKYICKHQQNSIIGKNTVLWEMVLAHCLSPCSSELPGLLEVEFVYGLPARASATLLDCTIWVCQNKFTARETPLKSRELYQEQIQPITRLFFLGELSADASRHQSHCSWQQSLKRLRPVYSVLPCSRTSKILWCFLPHDIPLQREMLLITGITSAQKYVTDKKSTFLVWQTLWETSFETSTSIYHNPVTTVTTTAFHFTTDHITEPSSFLLDLLISS